MQLANFLGTETVFIGLLNEDDNKLMDTIALCYQGEIIENFSYSLNGTPCAQVVSNELCLYPDNVQKYFPEDHLLKEMKVQGYIGIPMLDSRHAVLGIMAVLDTKPIKNTAYVSEILEIFSTRAAAEVERKKYEDEIRSSAQHLRLYREQVPIASIEWNMDFKVVDWNNAAEKIFGYSQEEIKQINFLEKLVPDHQRHKVQQLWHRIIKHKEQGVTTNENITKSGQVILCEWHATPLINKNGDILGMATVVMDITAEQRALKALVKKEEEQREILNSIIDAVITVDDIGNIITFNPSAEHLFGYDSKDVLGTNIESLLSFQDETPYRTFIDFFIKAHNKLNVSLAPEICGKKRNKELFPVRISVAELPKASNGRHRFIASIQDLTLFKRQEEQLNRTQKMDALGKLTGGIAHDFNNILGVILGYGELLSKKVVPNEILAKYVEQIIRAGERGAELTRKLLAYSRQQPEKIAKVNLNQLSVLRNLNIKINLIHINCLS